MGEDTDRLPDITLDTVERLAKSWDSGNGWSVLRIVAEDRRLRAEVERLRKTVQDDDAIIDELRCDCAKLETEIERLRKEVTQVRHDAYKEGYQTRAEEERENP